MELCTVVYNIIVAKLRSLLAEVVSEDSANCKSGNYSIALSLTYTCEGEIIQDREDVAVHIKFKIERYRWPIAIIGLIIAFLSLAASVGLAEVLLIPALEDVVSGALISVFL